MTENKQMDKNIIRKYEHKDREAVERIQLETYLLGKPLDIEKKKSDS